MTFCYRYVMQLAVSFVLLCLMPAAVSASVGDVAATGSELEKHGREAERLNTRASKVQIVTNKPKSKSIVERLKPGDEFQSSLKRIASTHNLKAGVIVSAVGSLSAASLRFAGANEANTIEGPLEVVSVTGTISDTSMHVHLSVSDSTGKTLGGHLMPGCKIFTTIELVILDLSDEWTFDRKTDEATTYLELDPQRVIDK